LSASAEVKDIECVGFRFTPDERLIAPAPRRKGNLVLTSRPQRYGDLQGLVSSHYDPDHLLELTRTQDSTLLRIDTQEITAVIAASPHLLYTLSDDVLQEIWIVNPMTD
jgi:hypothetical protein